MTASLPVIGGSRLAGAVATNAYVTELVARVAALGGGSMTAQLPIPLNEAQRATWASLLNTALTELEGRIAALEASVNMTSPTLVRDNSENQVVDASGNRVIVSNTGSASVHHEAVPFPYFHAPFHYEGSSDPGAVGAGKWWADTSNLLLKRRNAGNSAWIMF